MAKARIIQSSFTSGEVSPRLLARVDLAAYTQALKKMENATPLTHGGARKRPGTLYVGDIKDPTRPVRLIPFVYSRIDSYTLVINAGVVRFIRDGAYIMTGSPAMIYEIPHTYTDDELLDVTYAQAGNVMIMAHSLHKPARLDRTASDDWSITNIDFNYRAGVDYWYETAYIRFKIVSTGTGFLNGDVITVQTDGNGVIVAIDTSGVLGSGTITGTTINAELDPVGGVLWNMIYDVDTTGREEFTVTANDVVAFLSNTNPGNNANNNFGSVLVDQNFYLVAQWSLNNYPSAVAFFEQRVYFGGSITDPQTIWGSEIGDFFTLSLGAADNAAVQFTAASNKFSQIQHLETARTLLPLTYASEFSMSGTSNGGITPSAVFIRENTFHGTSPVKPIRVGQEILFSQRDGKKIRAISYDITIDSNVAPDLSLLAEHITGTGITDMTYQQDPDSIIYMIRDDGVMLSLTHLREQEVTAWARHLTDGLFKNVTTVPEGKTDVVYSVVERVINGSTVQYIEQLSNAIYTDATITNNTGAYAIGSPALTWAGLDKLEGKLVAIRADGKVHPSKTVVGGQVVLDYPVTNVDFGLPFTLRLQTLHPELITTDGTSQGAQTAVSKVVLRLQDSIGVEVNGEIYPPYVFPGALSTAPDLYTGDIAVQLLGWRSPLDLNITQSLPTPTTILGVIMTVTVNDA